VKTILMILVILMIPVSLFAVPSCTDWTLQTDGTYWRTCVDDQGRQYCEQTVDKKTITRVKCQ
jgi:hypothetical protein